MPDALLPMRALPRRGPLDGVAAVPGIEVLGPLRRVSLHGDIAYYGDIALSRTPLRAIMSDETAILWLGPDEWLVLAPDGDPVMHANGSVVDISHRQIALRLSGPRAAWLLNAACPLDLAVPPINFCSRTVFGKAQIMVWKRGENLFHLEVARSFAAYVHGVLREAAVEFS